MHIYMYLIEVARNAGTLPALPELSAAQQATINHRYPLIVAMSSVIRHNLKRSSKTGSRLQCRGDGQG